MKKLKNYIKNYINESYLNESAWDIEDNIEDDNKELVLNEVKKFIADNYNIVDINSCEFVFDEKKNKYIISYNQGVILKSNSKQLTNGLFEWHVVGGNFYCSNCIELKSLEGAPKEVGGGFSCRGCENLTTLKGAPKEVGGLFGCFRCPKLKTLEGAPQKVGGVLSCHSCAELKSLKGAPREVGGDLDCSGCHKLETLEGAPEYVGGNFDCYDCPKLSSLDGIGKVKGEIVNNLG